MSELKESIISKMIGLVRRILYYFVKNIAIILSRSFFREIHVIGLENIPKKGPVILCGTHNNQFMDAILMIAMCPRPVNFIIAAKSVKKPILGFFVGLMNVIPVKRAIDCKKIGKGRITKIDIEKMRLTGAGCVFRENTKRGDTVRIKFKSKEGDLPLTMSFKIVEVLSDESVRFDLDPMLLSKMEVQFGAKIKSNLESEYLVLPKLDQKKVYKKTLESLNEGKLIGIFPEGGSHDQTKVLKIKPGACIFNYRFFEKYQRKTSMITMGINYFGAHRFRSKVVINFGSDQKIRFTKEERAQMGESCFARRKISGMVEKLERDMKAVKLTAPTYKELLALHYVKEIYALSAAGSVDENFRIYKEFCNLYEEISKHQDVKNFMKKVQVLRQDLRVTGMKITEVTVTHKYYKRDLLKIFLRILVLFIWMIPFFLFFWPLQFVLVKIAEKNRLRALKNSVVKSIS